MHHTPDYKTGLILTTLATLCWGGGTVLSKYAIADGHEGMPLFLVQLLAALLFVLLCCATRLRGSRREAGHGWLGLLEPGLAYGLGIIGLKSASATQAVVIQALEGFMIVAVAFLLFRQRVSRRVLLCGAVAVPGVLLVNSGELGGNMLQLNPGLVWIALGTLVAALYVVLTERLIHDQQQPFLLVFWQLLAATLAVAAIVWLNGDLPQLSAHVTPLVCASGIVTYALSFILYLYGMRYIPVSVSAFLLCLTPVFGVALSVLLLGERLSVGNGAGIVLVIAALVALSRSQQSAH